MLRVNLELFNRTAWLKCQGDAIAGDEANYVFDLITRDHECDVVLDVDDVEEIGTEGLLVIKTGSEWLHRLGHRLLLRNSSGDLRRALGVRQASP